LKLSIVNFESKISFLGAAAAADAAADEGAAPPFLLIAASACGSPAPIALDACFFPIHLL
jgi:hypothetical protein